MKALDLIGAKFGKLKIIERAENNRHGKSMWLCKCECGNETVAIGSRIQNGLTKSCGCGVIESTVKRSTKHGLRHTKLYGIRMSMYDRCYNENCKDYKHYGGRGIKICDEWLDRGAGIQTFVDWAQANGYKEGLTIDRINVDGHYEPENCRWVDRIEQAQPLNRRKRKDNRSGYTGVEQRSDNGKWLARITVNKTEHRLGEFETQEEAITARKEAEIRFLTKDSE